jgi:uncharacterized protein YndB with AHSA1/START domain
MPMYKFVKEYEFRASPRLLYPYISTASGMQAWFCDQVVVDNINHRYNFIWDKTDHWAKLTIQKLNKHTKFDFVRHNDMQDDESSYIEFRLDHNDMTQSVYLKVIDNSAMEDHEELEELWDGLVQSLKEQVGG